MKFNLENFPKGDYDNIYEKWKKGFENELRETLAFLQKWNPRKLQNAKNSEWNQGYKEAWTHTIKEILGE